MKLGEVLDTERTEDGEDIKVDLGGGEIRTAQHYEDAGSDSLPLPGDTASLEELDGEGRVKATGYVDAKNPGKAAGGEKRIYARDADTGEVVAEIWLKNSGAVVIEAKGPVEIKTPNTVTVDSPDVRLSDAAGAAVARVGDLVAVSVPSLLSAAPGSPCVPVPPTAVTPTGGYVGVGQIISGQTKVQA